MTVPDGSCGSVNTLRLHRPKSGCLDYSQTGAGDLRAAERVETGMSPYVLTMSAWTP
jgi:hypothetical protein